MTRTKKRILSVLLILFIGGLLVALSCCLNINHDSFDESKRFRDGKFHNDKAFATNELNTLTRIFWRYATEKRIDATPVNPVPLQKMHREQLIADSTQGDTLYRLGHSSLLLALAGEFWLIDPVFAERASPFSWAGPKRFHPTPISLEQLPDIRGVIISHDHYDHLDKKTIEQLKDKVQDFVTPLGVGQHLRQWGVDTNKIHELDWWQNRHFGAVSLTATPAQHFSGRGLLDGNKSLWSSWVIQTAESKIFFSGDSGYFDGFKQIGERLGPFDLTLIENGAYDRDWSDVHMTPEQTLQAHLDVKGKMLLPVHNGTFDLALHPWFEPLQRISALAAEQQIPLITPIMGEPVPLPQGGTYPYWWSQGAD